VGGADLRRGQGGRGGQGQGAQDKEIPAMDAKAGGNHELIL
jgi:hypothetical protein